MIHLHFVGNEFYSINAFEKEAERVGFVSRRISLQNFKKINFPFSGICLTPIPTNKGENKNERRKRKSIVLRLQKDGRQGAKCRVNQSNHADILGVQEFNMGRIAASTSRRRGSTAEK